LEYSNCIILSISININKNEKYSSMNDPIVLNKFNIDNLT
jgi:hypothetical protein